MHVVHIMHYCLNGTDFICFVNADMMFSASTVSAFLNATVD